MASLISEQVTGSCCKSKRGTSSEVGTKSGGWSVGEISSAMVWATEVKNSLKLLAISVGSSILQLLTIR